MIPHSLSPTSSIPLGHLVNISGHINNDVKIAPEAMAIGGVTVCTVNEELVADLICSVVPTSSAGGVGVCGR